MAIVILKSLIINLDLNLVSQRGAGAAGKQQQEHEHEAGGTLPW